jgi:hypothetical protein
MRRLTVLNLPLQKGYPGVALGVGFIVAVFGTTTLILTTYAPTILVLSTRCPFHKHFSSDLQLRIFAVPGLVS